MTPDTFPRRSFVYRRLLDAGSTFVGIGNVGLAQHSSNEHAPLKLIDLSVFPRWGLKGRGTAAWIGRYGATMPGSDNRAEYQTDGSLIARLSPAEVLILAPIHGSTSLAETIERMSPDGEDACYPVPRLDSHCWFCVRGEDAHKMFAKLCAIDLAPDRFAPGQIAQTSVARLSAIVVRHEIPAPAFDANTPSSPAHDAGGMKHSGAFSLLADSASAEYLWDCLLDAMSEFGGYGCGAESM